MIKEIFDTSFLDSDKPKLHPNYGKPWTAEERTKLAVHFITGCKLPILCHLLGRPASGVMPKLEDMHLIEQIDGMYFRVPQGGPVRAKVEPTKEITMKKPPVVLTKTFTFIDDTDAAELSDEQIFQKIADMEAEIAKWGAIKSRPKKLEESIKKMEASIAALVKYVDERTVA